MDFSDISCKNMIFGLISLFAVLFMLILILNIFDEIYLLFFYKKLKLNEQSVVLITGGLHGIGEKLSYLFAKNN